MENKLVLKHQNGKITEYEPISFDYAITHIDQPEYDDNGEFAGHKTECFSKIPISQIWQVFSSSTFRNQIEITEITCRLLPYKQYNTDYAELINMMVWKEKASVMCDGELTMADGTNATLHNCAVVSKVDNKISFRFDFMEIHIDDVI